MASFAPRFCQIHLKIHVCDEIEISSQVKQRTEMINAKVRKLTGTQTAEEKKQLEEKRNRALKIDGTLSAILAKAKKKNEEEKNNNPIASDEENTAVSENSLMDRMAALRNKMVEGPVGDIKSSGRGAIPKSSIQNIIDDARDNVKIAKEESDEEIKNLDAEQINKKSFRMNVKNGPNIDLAKLKKEKDKSKDKKEVKKQAKELTKKEIKKEARKEAKKEIKKENKKLTKKENKETKRTYTEKEVQELIAEAVQYTLSKHKK